MGTLETRGTEEKIRDISYSEISLPFREIPDDITDKLYEIHITLEEYVNAFFEENSESSESATINISEYEVKSSIFRTSFMRDNNERLRILEAIEMAVKHEILNQDINIDSIFGISIQDGNLFVYYGEKSGARSIKVDISRRTVGELVIQELTNTWIDALESENLTEQTITVLGGISATVLTAGSAIYGVESRYIRSIRIDGSDGARIIVDGYFHVSQGANIDSVHILDILERNNVVLNTETMSFVDTRNTHKPISLIQIERDLRHMQKGDFLQKLESLGIDTSHMNDLSESEFNAMRSDMAEMFRDIRKNGSTSQMSLKEMTTTIIKNPGYAKIYLTGGLLILGLDTFSGAFADPDDLASYVAETATIVGFGAGMMGGGPLIRFLQGARIGKRIPTGPGKVIGGLALGFGSVMGGNYLAQGLLDMNNRFTRSFPEREDWMQKYGFDNDFEASRIINKIGGGFMYDAVDYEGLAPRFEQITGLQAPDLPWVDTRDGVDTFLWNSSIDVGTDPIEYMSYSSGRTIDGWNRRSEVFRENALTDIKALIEEYRNKENNRSNEVKREFSEALLKAIGMPQGGTRYVNLRIYDKITGYFGNNDFQGYDRIIIRGHDPKYEQNDESMQGILTLISHELGKLEIDNGYREDFGEDLDFEKMVINAALDGNGAGIELAKIQLHTSRGSVSQETINYDDLAFIAALSEEQRAFLEKITERMYNRERLIEEGYYTDQNGNRMSKSDGQSYMHYMSGAMSDIPKESNLELTYHQSHDEKMWEYFTEGIDSNEDHNNILSELGLIKEAVPDYYTDQDGEKISIEEYQGGVYRNVYTGKGEIPPGMIRVTLHKGEAGISIKPSQLFFRYFDRIIEVKKSQVFLENITTSNSGRAWESDSVVGEVEELTGISKENFTKTYIQTLSLMFPSTGLLMNYLTQDKSVVDR